MGSFSRSFTFDPQRKVEQTSEAILSLDELVGAVPPMEFTWAEGSTIFHTRARCSRLRVIEDKNRRSQRTEPHGMTLCAICRKISLLGRKG